MQNTATFCCWAVIELQTPLPLKSVRTVTGHSWPVSLTRGICASWEAGITDATSLWDVLKPLAAGGALELYRLPVQMRSVNTREVADQCISA